MNTKLKNAFKKEMSLAIKNYNNGALDVSFKHLERAHIIGQSFVIAHTLSHWWMLKIGIKRKDSKEIFGQITRIIASLIFSRIWVPIGNTGGANVHPLIKMPLPKDIEALIDKK